MCQSLLELPMGEQSNNNTSLKKDYEQVVILWGESMKIQN